MAEREEGRSSEEIRRDIEGTRAEMHETVDALERKLSPGQLLDQVRTWFREGGAGSAVSSAGDTVRDHPVPLALMGLGVAWLAVEKATWSEGDRLRRRYGPVGPGTRGRAEGRVGPYGGEEGVGEEDSTSVTTEAKGKAGSAAEKAKSKASAAARAMKEKASEVGEKASSATSRAGETVSRTGEEWQGRAGEEFSRAAEEARHRGRQMKHRFRSGLDEQPLAMGAVAFGLGLAGGLSLPTTRLEDRTMGGASDAVKGEAKDVVESGKEVVKDTARAAREEAEREGSGRAAGTTAARVAEKAKETAERRAREEEVDPEGVKKRSSRAKDRARDEAGD